MDMNTEIQKFPEFKDAQPLGRCWAALREDKVILVIPMRVPSDVDFNIFREKSIAVLKLLGGLAVGALFEKAGERYFLARPQGHKNRNKKKPRTVIKPLKLPNLANNLATENKE